MAVKRTVCARERLESAIRKEDYVKVIFVNHWDLSSPSGLHIFQLANSLAKLGVEVIAYFPLDLKTAALYGRPKFRCYGFSSSSPKRLARELLFRKDDHIVHAWTPRESNRPLAEELAQLLDAPCIVHMEDNEEAIIRARLEQNDLSEEALADPSHWESGGKLFGLAHPERYRSFLASAQGYTCIIESLLDFKPEHVPGHVFWPACEPEVFNLPLQASPEDKARYGIPGECVTLFYPGNVHANNLAEVTELYFAVAMLRQAGIPARIIKFGNYLHNIPELVLKPLGLEDTLVDLTDQITPAQAPQVLRAADFLVQPGRESAFNHYRFPCKLPLFLSSGRPVILPQSNVGRHLDDGVNCLHLHHGTAEEIYGKLLFLISNPDAASLIGFKGREFAQKHFNWENSAAGLFEFYKKISCSWKNRRNN